MSHSDSHQPYRTAAGFGFGKQMNRSLSDLPAGNSGIFQQNRSGNGLKIIIFQLDKDRFSGKPGGIGGLSFVAASYLACTVLSGCVYAACALRGNRKSFKITRRPIFAAIGAGCSLALYLAVNTYAAGVIDGSFHYPAHSGGSILLSTLVGVVLFKDKLSKRQIAACVLGLAAIVLMNF